MCRNMKFELIEHTADVGIKAYGESLKEMFESAASGLFSVIADPEGVKSVGEFKVVLQAEDKEQLLVDWLNELLYIHEVYEALLGEFTVDIERSEQGFELRGTVKGEQIDTRRHDLRNMVKAVTYHMLEVNEDKGYLVVILDI
jgi:SHS2 domain-containing protein